MTKIPLILLLLFTLHASSQEQLSMKQRADQLFERYEYFKSAQLYEILLSKKSDTWILERLADCYRLTGKYEDAEKYYSYAATAPDVSKASIYYYAESLLNNEKPEAAKVQFKRYYALAANIEQLAGKLATCDSASVWMKQKQAIKVENVQKLNSNFSEWGLGYATSNSIIFTSDRQISSAAQETDNRTGNNWFNLYTATLNGEQIKEFTVSSGNSPLEPDFHTGPVALNASGDTAYITVSTALSKAELGLDYSSLQRLYTRRLELVLAVKENGKWEIHSRFPYNNAKLYSIGHAALSADGKLIYFSSDRPGGQGKTDIWYCEKQKDGTWAKPINCGKTINTADEEAFPVMGGDGVLYFSSKGLPGMGGFDLFSATGSKSDWSNSVNLKYPFNSTRDDFTLATPDGFSGYFASNRTSGKGSDDIYRFTKDKPVNNPVTIIAKVDSNLRSGLPIPESVKYRTIKNIYYDLDKSFIRPDAEIELDKLVVLVRDNSSFRVQLYSHTDSRASKAYNLQLSLRRTESAKAYLVKNGISATRITAKGYGEENLANPCPDDVPCTEEQHQLNRRTEITVLEP